MDRDIIVESRKVTGKRTRDVILRRSQAQIDRSLTPAMKDAEREIELAWRVSAGHMGYVLSRFDDTPTGTSMRDNREAWMQIQVKKLREWENTTPDKFKNTVLDMVVFGKTLPDMEIITGVTKQTIMKWFKSGLNSYCINQGWGDQINPLTVRDD